MREQHSAAEVRRVLDRTIVAFFRAVSFEPGLPPAYERLRELFIARGLLINNTGSSTEISDLEQFIGIRQARFRAGEVTHYRVEEVSETTAIFGNVAHRASVFKRSGTRDNKTFETRGMIFTQFVRTPGGWLMSAAAWDDQRRGQVLSGHAEPTEFG